MKCAKVARAVPMMSSRPVGLHVSPKYASDEITVGLEVMNSSAVGTTWFRYDEFVRNSAPNRRWCGPKIPSLSRSTPYCCSHWVSEREIDPSGKPFTSQKGPPADDP